MITLPADPHSDLHDALVRNPPEVTSDVTLDTLMGYVVVTDWCTADGYRVLGYSADVPGWSARGMLEHALDDDVLTFCGDDGEG